MNPMTRRDFFALAGGLGAATLLPTLAAAQSASAPLITKTIPSTGERVPAVGLGTSRVFDGGGDPAKLAALAQVLRNLVAGGGKIIDTASSYGSAEGVVGELVTQAGLRRLKELRGDYASRFSFCCSRGRKRSTSMSVCFLGRRVSGTEIAAEQTKSDAGLSRVSCIMCSRQVTCKAGRCPMSDGLGPNW